MTTGLAVIVTAIAAWFVIGPLAWAQGYLQGYRQAKRDAGARKK